MVVRRCNCTRRQLTGVSTPMVRIIIVAVFVYRDDQRCVRDAVHAREYM